MNRMVYYLHLWVNHSQSSFSIEQWISVLGTSYLKMRDFEKTKKGEEANTCIVLLSRDSIVLHCRRQYFLSLHSNIYVYTMWSHHLKSILLDILKLYDFIKYIIHLGVHNESLLLNFNFFSVFSAIYLTGVNISDIFNYLLEMYSKKWIGESKYICANSEWNSPTHYIF